MKNKIIISGSIALGAILIILLIIFMVNSKNSKKEYQFTQVEKGNLQITVSCTGTINAQKTVEVGTQVSGTIAKLYADYNDKVKKHQILAVLDTNLLQIAVDSSQANLMKAQSQYDLSVKDYENNVELNKNKLISDFQLDQLRVTKEGNFAALKSAQADLKRARTNLDYATIRSPIDGTIIDRAVEEGQTVAASLSTPTLFTIAEDLSNVQIDALVTESDIGQILPRQKVEFSVAAYPDELFMGAVQEIHMKPTNVSDVINYDVVVYAKNRNYMLLPGMTATANFIVQEKDNIFMVPNTVFRFTPPAAVLKELKLTAGDRKKQSGPDAAPDVNKDQSNSKKNSMKDNSSDVSKQNGNDKNQKYRQRNSTKDATSDSSKQYTKRSQNNKNITRLWYVGPDKKLKFIVVRTGITDGQKTEIISNNITEDMKFINGYVTAKTASDNRQTPNVPRRLF